jgi:hypothetical protein
VIAQAILKDCAGSLASSRTGILRTLASDNNNNKHHRHKWLQWRRCRKAAQNGRRDYAVLLRD